MLTNLFSIFDTHMYKYSPFIFFIVCYYLLGFIRSITYFKNTHNILLLMCSIKKNIFLQFNQNTQMIQNKHINIKTLTFNKITLTLIVVIFFFNFYSLFPFILSITSHISLNMTLTFLIWLIRVVLALKRRISNFFSHLTPSGTPLALMSFIVLIETVSIIIRPVTLSVRLIANIVAGHLLLTLLAKFSLICVTYTMYSAIIIIILSILEIGVSLIQSYVLTLLCVLYFKEAF